MLSALTQPNYPKAAIGLEKNSVTAISLRKEGRGQFGIQQAATVELPENLLKPSFFERNISSTEEFRYLLGEAAETAGLMKRDRWSVSLPGNSGRSAILTLDAVPGSKQELEEVLDWKAEQSFGTPAAELRLSRQKIADDREGRSRYFATAVRLSVIDEFETVFESMGWKAGLILPRAVSEAKWLLPNVSKDSLLVSEQSDGFTALLLRNGEPRVVRSVTCSGTEIDDEMYRLLMFYNDRFGDRESSGFLDSLLVIGRMFDPARIQAISTEAFGAAISVLRPVDVGLILPGDSLSFHDVAAPGGLAALGFR
jgi:Tfp pilus assembly PilM family ATPase